MDSYDLFGEDVGAGMLDGLPDLGSDGFDPTPGQPPSQQPPQQAGPGASGGSAASRTAPPPYGQLDHLSSISQDNSLQKMSTFGEYPGHHRPSPQQHHMDGQGGMYGSPASQLNHHHHQQQHLAGAGYDTSGAMIGGGAPPSGQLCGPVTYQSPGTSGSGGSMRTNQFPAFCSPNDGGMYGLDQGGIVGRNETSGVEVGGAGGNDGIRGGGWNGSASQSYQVGGGNTYSAQMGPQQDPFRQQIGTYPQRQPEGQELGYCGQDPIITGGPGVGMARGYPPMQQRVPGFSDVGGGAENPITGAGVYQGPGVSGTMGQQQVGQGYVGYNQTHHHVQYSAQQQQGSGCEMDVVNQQTPQYNHVQMPQQHVTPVMGPAGHHHSFVSHRMQVPPVANHRHYVAPQHGMPQQQKVQMAAGTGESSPQYRTNFPQHSPQMSPRTGSIQQRVGSPGPPRMSPRPSQIPQQQLMQMSPGKPCLSPHPGQTTMSPRPPAALTPKASPSAGYPQVNPVVGQSSPVPAMPQQSTLQRLEQMVGPPTGSDYQQNQYIPDGMNAMNNPTLVVPNSNQGLNIPPQRVLSSLPTSSPLAVPSMQWGSTGHVPVQPLGMDMTGNSVAASESVPHQMRGPPVSGDPRISQAMGNSNNAQTLVGDESNGNRMQGMGGLSGVDPSCNIPSSPRIQGPEDVSLVPPITAESEQSMGMSEFPAVSGFKNEMVSVEQSSTEPSAVQKTGNMGTDSSDPSNGSYGTFDGVGGGDGCGLQLGSTPVDMPCPDPRFSGPVGSVGPYPAAGADGVSAPMPACPPGSVAAAVPSNLSTSTLDKPDMNSSGFPHVAEGPMQPGGPVLALPPGMPPHGGIPLHFDHQQEMSSLQQQLRELFCMPAQQPIPEVQEKVVRLQERLHILQQHMAQDHCSGGPQCILGPPTLPGVLPGDVQSTPVKGRGKGGTGTPKPKKSRKKKEDAGQPPGEVAIGPDGQPLPPAEPKPKKPKTPRKPREPKKPKEPKPPKEPKKKKEPKPPGEGKTPSKPRKSRSKKKEGAAAKPEAGANAAASGESQPPPAAGAVPAEGEGVEGIPPAAEVTAADTDSSPPAENAEGTAVATTPEAKAEKSGDAVATPAESTPGTEAGTPSATGEGTDGGTPATAKPKKPKRDRTKGKSPRLSTTPKIRNAKGMFSSFKKKTKNKGESEASDLEVTPPPSPEPEADTGVQKRRSARNTHRKKYVDDIELAISEDELHGLLPLALASSAASGGASVVTPSEDTGAGSPAQGEGAAGAGGVSGGSGESSVTTPVATEPSKRRRNPAPAPAGGEEEAEGVVKPNFVYINTTDEDSMIVQHVLAVRMGKREIRKGILKAPKEGGEVDSVAKEGETKKEGITEAKEVKSEAEPKEEEKKEDGQVKAEIPVVEEAGMKQSKAEVIAKEVQEEVKESLQEQGIEGDNILNIDKAGGMVVEGEQKEEGSKEENEGKPKEESEPKEIVKEEVDEESDDEDEEVEVVDVEEYFVKYRNFSYLHCEWKTEEELMKGDKRIAAKIKRFKQKMGQNTNIFENLEDEPFNPDYVEVDRVLDVAEHKDPNTGKTTKNYLVKWKGLQYEDATWELEEDIDPSKVEQFEIFRELPPKDQWKPKKKPTGELWEKLEVSPVYKNDNTLRAYQLEGLNWLLFSWYNGRNCILADEMGLGKTIQSIAFINAVYQWGIKRPFLVVAPLSTIPNWQREFEAWTDMNVIVYHGSTASRNMLQEYEMFYRDEKGGPMKDLPKFNVLITTFEIIIADCLELREFTWRLCVIDEAHRLKNRNCKLLEGLRLLNLEHRVLLSGTPLQNNVNELFSLLNFLEPSQFGSSESFLQEFGALKSETEVQKLQALLKPMMLRRLKEDVEKTIAPKEETVIEVELTNIQKKYYRAILERNFSFLSKGTTTANVPNLMNTMMELRKCCIHPYLLNGAEEQIQLEYRQTNGEDPDAYFKALIHSSGKMVLIDKLLPKLKANGHRVLVFSQMVRCLDILEDYLMYRKYPFERIDGRIRGNLRQAAIDRYCKPDSDRFVFLLCTKAGGLGINLTAADTVIIYDSDWNPQNDLQAQARCHRIGQQKMVKVYRLLCRNTYEREMFDKASLKLGLDRAVLQSMNTAQGGKDPVGTAVGQKQLSKKEIEDLLKKGAYGAIMEEDNAGDKFCEEDIDQILERRTQVITLETGEKGSTFSKASFASSGIRSDIDIDDPDFWKKWAKKADIDMSEGGEKNELVISEPRRRTQIKRYGHDESMVDMSELDSSSDSDDEGSNGIGRGRAGGRRCQRSSKFGRRPRSLSKYYDGDHIPREGEIVYGSWARSECFKVEKGLLTFGWGRWPEILAQGQFRRGWRESDVEDCARVILLYCLRFYHGDDKIKGFIWDLITPTENGESRIQRNHMGLSAPVPRGRKGKKKMKEARMLNAMMEVNDWSRNEKYDGDIFLENNYKKHLTRHANKVLLRVRMLYYIKHEIIGDLVQQIAEGVPVKMLEIYPPYCDAPPARWWDVEADKSLLAGTYKHGYERYREIRADPQLSFLAQVGPPPPLPEDTPSSTPSSPPRDTPRQRRPNDSAANLDEDKISEDEDDCLVVEGGNVPPNAHQRQDEHGIHHHANQDHHLTPEETLLRYQQSQNAAMAQAQYSGMSAEHAQVMLMHNHNMMAQLGDGSQQDDRENSAGGTWPSVADLNTRLRRVITSYQRNYKKEELKMAQKAKAAAAAAMPDCRRWPQKMDRKEKMEQMLREREKSQLDISQRRWSRREEQDFYRTVSTFGVEYDRKRGRYDWNRFRTISHLERKYDEAMTEYYKAFLAMCKRSCGLKLLDDEVNYPDMPVEPLPEDKARRCLERIELLRRVREDILSHPRLGERLALCRQSSDLPEWWIPGRHDRELVLGAAKHGLGRTDCYILNDPELSFRDFVREGNLRSKEPQTADLSKESEVSTKVSGWTEEGGPKDVLQMEGDEMIVKLEKGEGTLKIERIGGKKEPKVTEEKKAEEVAVKEEVEEVKKEETVQEEEEEKVEEKEVPEAEVKEEPAEAEVKAEEGELEVKTEVKSEEEMEGVEIKEESEVKMEEECVEAESAVKEEEENIDLKPESVKQEVEDEVEKMEVEEEPVEQKETVEEKEVVEEKAKSPIPSPKEAVEEKAPTEEEPMQVEEEKGAEEQEKGEEEVETEPKETLESEKEEIPKEEGEAKVQEESGTVEEKKEEVAEEKASEVSEEKAEEKETAVEEAKEDKEKKEEEKKDEEKEVEKEKEEAKEEEEGAKKEEEVVEEKSTVTEGEAVVGEDEKVEEAKKAEAPAPEIEIVPVTEPKEETPKDNEVQCLTVTNQDTAVSSSTSVIWPKDRVLQTRLEQIVHLVEHGEWPANNTSCLLPLQSQSIPSSAQSSIVAMGSSMARLVGGLLGALGNLQAGRGMQGKGLMGEGLMGADVARSLAELKSGVSGLPSSDVVTITTTTADHVTLAPVQRQRQMAVQQSLLPPSLSGMGRRGSELQMGRMPGSSSSPVAHQSSMGNLAPPTKKRKRHIAIDVETERAKLHALLNSSANQSSQKMSSMWGGDEDSPSGDASSRRMQGGMQPPPAHQQQGSTRVLSMPLSSYDLGKYHPSSSQASTPPSDTQAGGTSTPLIKSIGPTTIIPGTSSTLTPIDLSSGLPKVDSGNKNSSEAQDFSMSSKSKQKSKLDDMLDKLMKRKVCVEEPAGKEKKRRKLDEIVLGLSAAKEQSLFSDVKKSGTSITPIPLPASHSSQGRSRHGTSSPHQQQPASSKPFTITVTSVPPSQSRPSPQGTVHNQPPKCQRPPAPGRPPSSGHPQTSQSNPLQQQQQQQRMEQSSQMRSSQSSTAQQMLQQQQQNQRKSVYESMLADLGKVADFSRMGSYSHEAKVNKWLAEQTSMLPERSHSSMGQHSSGSSSAAQVVDLQSSMRRRRPRIDPSLLDWKKLSGEENISVINRVTGKKISGTKAPQLKSLGAWLVENPMFDIDPKWADLVKERGNLPRDLQKRLPPGITVATPGTSSSPTNSGDQRKKGPGRPMSSSHSQGAPTSSSGFPASSAPSPVTTTPSLSTLAAGLSNLNPALLSGLGLSAFDPKNNPLLMPFTRGTGSNSAASALPSLGNMGALAGLGGLGGVSNLSLANSLFANLAGLNLPSMDSSSQSESRGNSSGGTSGTSSNKNRKSESSKGNSTPNIPTSSAFPFFFPNPSLLYNPLGLGGLNPFSLQPGMNPAYDTLAQQCRLLNGVSTSTSTPTSNTTSTTSSSAGRPSSSQNSRGRPSLASNHRHRPRDAKEALEKQQRHLQRLLNAQGLGQWSGDLELSEATEGSSAGKNGETPSKTEQEVSEERTGKQAANAAEGGPSPNDASEDCGESPSQSTQRAKVPAGAGTGGGAAKRPRPTRLEETVSKLKESVVEKKSSKSASEEGKGEGPHSPSASGGEEEKEA